MSDKDLEVKEKQEARTPSESTRPGPAYIPAVDIYESKEAMTLIADMPGVPPENLDIDLNDGQLTIHGRVSPPPNMGTHLLREYGVGDFYREFTLGRLIDQSRIEARIRDGVLILTLPKVDAAKPRKISVKAE